MTACKPFPGEHTANNIRHLMEEEDRALDLPKDTVKVNVTDTASDMLAGRTVNGYSSISCGIHKLMLVGDDAEREEKNEVVAEAVKAGAALVNHARHSNPFHRALKKYCNKTGHRYSKLVTHCKTRWNSKCDMLDRSYSTVLVSRPWNTTEPTPACPSSRSRSGGCWSH